MKQISLVQVQPQAIIQTQETVYIKSEPQILSTIPSTSTAIIVTAPSHEPPSELIIPDVKEEDIQIDSQDAISMFTNPDAPLLSSMDSPVVDDSVDSTEVKMEEVITG